MIINKDKEYRFYDRLFEKLWPITRSITGKGIKKSFDIINEYMPIKLEKTKSGTKVYDWKIPLEWQFNSAKLFGPDGEIYCDSDRNNLEVVNYSAPMNDYFNLEEIKEKIHSIPETPDAIPYVTSYYKEDWGFCMPHNKKLELPNGKYKVEIDSSFIKGNVITGHAKISGNSSKEILLSSYLCHPSMANNELSGPLVLVGLYNRIKKWKKHNYSYRFLLNPETIGSLCFIKNHESHLRKNLLGGLILTCLGGKNVNSLRYKASRKENSHFNNLVKYYQNKKDNWIYEDFSPLGGSDERQYCAPGFNFPVGQIARDVYGEDKKWYHTSLDTKENMGIDSIVNSIDQIENLLIDSEYSGNPINLAPFGEPQLGKRGLYPNLNSSSTRNHSSDSIISNRSFLNYILTILSKADGQNSLIEIASELKIDLEDLKPIIDILLSKNLISYGS